MLVFLVQCSKINENDTQNTTNKAPKCAVRTPLVPSRPPESLKAIFAIKKDSKIGGQKGPRRTHNALKAGVISNFPHDCDKHLSGTAFA